MVRTELVQDNPLSISVTRREQALRRSRFRGVTRGILSSVMAVIFIYSMLDIFSSSSYPSEIEFNYVPKPIRPERFPVSSTIHLPNHRPTILPRIQHEPVVEKLADKIVRESRLQDVRNTFLRAWNGYKAEAWGKDELRPISGGFKTKFCGWAATLVDTLDTLWIMELYEEFELALEELKNVDFTNTEGCQINLFETTIRHLGGLLSAFDISGGKRVILVQKAVELAEVLFTAFDTPNRMPSPHYVWSA
jgi:mannosyl-oligosaccharide alpha-1,2-mannosidase